MREKIAGPQKKGNRANGDCFEYPKNYSQVKTCSGFFNDPLKLTFGYGESNAEI